MGRHPGRAAGGVSRRATRGGRPGHGSDAAATVAALKGSRDDVWALGVSMQEASWRDSLPEPLSLAHPRSCHYAHERDNSQAECRGFESRLPLHVPSLSCCSRLASHETHTRDPRVDDHPRLLLDQFGPDARVAYAHPMRDVIDALERLAMAWYLTGSEALAAYGSPRQTLDTDVLVDTTESGLRKLAAALGRDYYFAEPLRVGPRLMASVVERSGAGKVDFIVRDSDSWGREAMARRRRWDHPVWGAGWVSSLEDLVLAKLEWSEGTSELQLRDCGMLLRMNSDAVDREYLARWARVLGVHDLLREDLP